MLQFWSILGDDAGTGWELQEQQVTGSFSEMQRLSRSQHAPGRESAEVESTARGALPWVRAVSACEQKGLQGRRDASKGRGRGRARPHSLLSPTSRRWA